MRISDWSSDVCSSDLPIADRHDRIEMVGESGLIACRKFVAPIDLDVVFGGERGVGRRRPDENELFLEQEFGDDRSEEHTSELQSLMRSSYAVFCLKKKTNTTNQQHKVHNTHKHTAHR